MKLSDKIELVSFVPSFSSIVSGWIVSSMERMIERQ